MNEQIEKFRQRRAERMAEKNKDGGPGSGKKPKGGSKSNSGSSSSTKPATKEEHFNLLKSFADRREFMESS